MIVICALFQDPAICSQQAIGSYPPYDDGLGMGIFVNDSSGKPIVGKVKNLGYVVIITYTVLYCCTWQV